ncbi:hypothetical protein HKX48_008379 [Thoreauomyces humboldtii]|nr:hypothetical protein HKX48_008379 [Thoreauomyces humboldtii]
MHAPIRQSSVAIALLLASSVTAQLTQCQKSMVQQLTNEYENSQMNFAFDYCQNIGDGRGFTCGIVGFTTATHDAFKVVDTYTNSANYTQEFVPYYGRLLELNSTGDSSTSGLSGFCDAWYSAAANNPTFRAIQVQIADSLYYTPSQALADTYNLTLSLSRGQFYDCAIQEGVDADQDSLPSVAARTPNRDTLDEATWIGNFLANRKTTLCHPSDAATQSAWCASVTRVNSYQNLLSTGQTTFPDAGITALDNDGNPTLNIKCDLNLWTEYFPGPKYADNAGGSGGMSKGAIAAIVIVVAILLGVAAYFAYCRWKYGTWDPRRKNHF